MTNYRLGLAALGAAIGLAGTANAAPTLQIVDAVGALKTAPTSPANCTTIHCETIGDAGGTSFAWPGGPGGGGGIPTVVGGWTAGAPGFAPDPSFSNNVGTTGWHSSYLKLTEKAKVTFQFMGAGDSSFINSFHIDTGSGYAQIFRDGQAGGATNPCPVGPTSTNPTCDILGGGFPNQNQYTAVFGPGLIKFGFGVNSAIATVFNDGQTNGDIGRTPGFFLGVDPYLASGTFQNSGKAVYAGLTDTPSTGDHDFQDMGVRIAVSAVPEPTTWGMMLVGFGIAGYSLRSRKNSARATA